VRVNHAARELLCLGDSSVVLGQPLDSGQWDRWPLGPRAIAAALRPAVEALRRGETLRDVEAELGSEGRRARGFSCGPLRDPAVQQADRMVELLKLLLDFSRREAGRLALERSQVDLAAVVGAAVEELRATTDRHRLVVRAPAAVVGCWDELQLKEVLTNLLT